MGLINWNKIFQTYDDRIKEAEERKKKQYEDAKKNVSSFISTLVDRTKDTGKKVLESHAQNTELLAKTLIDPIAKPESWMRFIKAGSEALPLPKPEVAAAKIREKLKLPVLPEQSDIEVPSWEKPPVTKGEKAIELAGAITSNIGQFLLAGKGAETLLNKAGKLVLGTKATKYMLNYSVAEKAKAIADFVGSGWKATAVPWLKGAIQWGIFEAPRLQGNFEEKSRQLATSMLTGGVLNKVVYAKDIPVVSKYITEVLSPLIIKTVVGDKPEEAIQEVPWYAGMGLLGFIGGLKITKSEGKTIIPAGEVSVGGNIPVPGEIIKGIKQPLMETGKFVNPEKIVGTNNPLLITEGKIEKPIEINGKLYTPAGGMQRGEKYLQQDLVEVIPIKDYKGEITTYNEKGKVDLEQTPDSFYEGIKVKSGGQEYVLGKRVDAKELDIDVTTIRGTTSLTMPKVTTTTKIAPQMEDLFAPKEITTPTSEVPSIGNVLKSFSPETIGRTIKDPEVVIKEAAELEKGTVGVKLSPEETKIKFSEAVAAKLLGRVANTSDMKAFNQVYEWMTRPVVQAHPEATIPEAIASRILSRGVEPVMKVFNDIAKGPQDRKTISRFWEETAKLPVKYSYADYVINYPTISEVMGGKVSSKVDEEFRIIKPVTSLRNILKPKTGIKTRTDLITVMKEGIDQSIKIVDNFIALVKANNISYATLIKTREGTLTYTSPVIQKVDTRFKEILEMGFDLYEMPQKHRERYYPHDILNEGGVINELIDSYTNTSLIEAIQDAYKPMMPRKKNERWSEKSDFSGDVETVLKNYLRRAITFHYTRDVVMAKEMMDKIKQGSIDKINVIGTINQIAKGQNEMVKETIKGDIKELQKTAEGVSEKAKRLIKEDIAMLEETSNKIGEREIFDPGKEFNVMERLFLNPNIIIEKMGLLEVFQDAANADQKRLMLMDELMPIIESKNKVLFIKQVAEKLGFDGEKKINFYNDALREMDKEIARGKDITDIMTNIVYKVSKEVTTGRAMRKIEEWIKTHDIINPDLEAFVNHQLRRIYLQDITTTFLQKAQQEIRTLIARRYIGLKAKPAVKNLTSEPGRLYALVGKDIFKQSVINASKRGDDISKRYGVSPEQILWQGIIEAAPRKLNPRAIYKGYKKYTAKMDKGNWFMFLKSEDMKNRIFLHGFEIEGRTKGLTGEDLLNYVLNNFRNYAIPLGDFVTPHFFDQEIFGIEMKTIFQFAKYPILDWGITLDKAGRAIKGEGAAQRYIWRLLQWKIGQFVVESIAFKGNLLDVMGGKVGLGPLSGLLGLVLLIMNDKFKDYNEKGYSLSDYVKDKALQEARDMGLAVLGVGGGAPQLWDSINAYMKGGIWSPTEKFVAPVEYELPEILRAATFGMTATSAYRWTRQRNIGSGSLFGKIIQQLIPSNELPLGKEDSEIIKNMIEDGDPMYEIIDYYLDILTKRAISTELTETKRAETDVEEERAKKKSEEDIRQIEKAREKGFKVFPFNF